MKDEKYEGPNLGPLLSDLCLVVPAAMLKDDEEKVQPPVQQKNVSAQGFISPRIQEFWVAGRKSAEPMWLLKFSKNKDINPFAASCYIFVTKRFRINFDNFVLNDYYQIKSSNFTYSGLETRWMALP